MLVNRMRSLWRGSLKLGDMTILDRLGLGGQGDVWLARDRLLRRLVTLKKIDALSAEDPSEGLLSLQARVDVAHPAIPTVFAVIPDGRKTWLVGEYVKGIALIDLLGELSAESVYWIARDLMSALSCLERLNLVHGDLSPGNVVLDVNGQIRLLDFESCSRVGEALTSSSTLGFAAPERHNQKVALPTIDTWSVGALIIWLITGEPPRLVLDDLNNIIAVEVGEVDRRSESLLDLLNLAITAVRIDPQLRPAATDLDQRLKRTYRWLEPVNRSTLADLVRSSSAWEVASKTSVDAATSAVNATQRNSRDSPTAKSGVAILQGIAANLRIRPQQRLLRGAVLLLILSTLLVTAHRSEQRYALVINASEISPTTKLPAQFDQQWVANMFHAALPNNWSNDRSNDRSNDPDDARADADNVVSLNIGCSRGICELLVEHRLDNRPYLDHAVVVATEDARVWKAALANLARAISDD